MNPTPSSWTYGTDTGVQFDAISTGRTNRSDGSRITCNVPWSRDARARGRSSLVYVGYVRLEAHLVQGPTFYLISVNMYHIRRSFTIFLSKMLPRSVGKQDIIESQWQHADSYGMASVNQSQTDTSCACRQANRRHVERYMKPGVDEIADIGAEKDVNTLHDHTKTRKGAYVALL